jgi:hypothetical protein
VRIAGGGFLVGRHTRIWGGLCFVSLALSGCVQDAKLVQVTGDGGVVTYPLKRDSDSIYSSFRNEAFSLIEQHCNGKYVIVREGETKSMNYASGMMEGEEPVLTRRFWGIQFRCQSHDGRGE